MKSYFFDTSVIVAGLVQPHPLNNRAAPWLVAVEKGHIEASISTHALAEIFNTFTRLQINYTLSLELINKMLHEQVIHHMQIVSLNQQDYVRAMAAVQSINGRGPLIYDALHLEACLKKKIPQMVTFNSSDFTRLADGQNVRIINPSFESPPPNPRTPLAPDLPRE